MTLAEKLKKAREQAGYSQSQVAEKLNISRQAVSRWENGRAYPDIDNLVLLSEMYGVSTDELLKDKVEDIQLEVNTPIKNEQEAKDNNRRLILLLIVIISTLFPGIGLLVTLSILLYCLIDKKKVSKVYNVIMAVCLVVNIINTGVLIKSFGDLFIKGL